MTIQLPDWCHLDPLGELVHHHQYVCHVTSGWFELSHHIQTPYRKRPSDRNCFERRSRHMRLLGKSLASFTSPDYGLCISKSSGPIEPMPKHLGHQSSCAAM